MARLASLLCLVAALALCTCNVHAYDSDVYADGLLKGVDAGEPLPLPFELTATLYSSSSLDGSNQRESIIDDIHAASIDTHLPEELLSEYMPVMQAEQQQAQQFEGAQLQQDGASIPLPFELPEEVTLFSTVHYQVPELDSSKETAMFNSNAAIGAAVADADTRSDSMLLARLPVGLPLQQAFLQPAAALAADLVDQVWQAVQQLGPFAMPAGQPVGLQVADVLLDNTDSQDLSSSSFAVQQQQQGVDQQLADMEVSVTYETFRSQNWWSRLFGMLSGSRGTAAAIDDTQAVAIADAVVEALGRRSGEFSDQEQQGMREMTLQLDATGSYSGSYQGDAEDLPATAAAAVAAAAASAMSKDPDWSDMEMDIELTHTTHKFTATWAQTIMLGAAMLVVHIGLCLLLAPLYTRCFGGYHTKDDSEQQQQPVPRQFIVSSGLKEAGMYQPLLSHEQEV